MSENTPRDLKTRALILRRTNFKESDRILSLLTPEGKFSVLARGVRKERSKLAGGIEMFCLTEVNLHRGRGDLLILTSAKMLTYYKNILSDLSSLELGSQILKSVNRATEQVSSPDYFHLLDQSLSGLNQGLSHQLVETWFLLNFAQLNGETPNFSLDTSGEKLHPEKTYFWDFAEKALREDQRGNISAPEIKIGRFLLCSDLKTAGRLKSPEEFLPPLKNIAQSLNQF